MCSKEKNTPFVKGINKYTNLLMCSSRKYRVGERRCCNAHMFLDGIDEEFFDGREFLAPQYYHPNKALLLNHPTAATNSNNNESGNSRTTLPVGVNSYERRDIIAKGMSRFEGIDKFAPPQPPIERLSPRIINILGMNPAPYTLNGTNVSKIET